MNFIRTRFGASVATGLALAGIGYGAERAIFSPDNDRIAKLGECALVAPKEPQTLAVLPKDCRFLDPELGHTADGKASMLSREQVLNERQGLIDEGHVLSGVKEWILPATFLVIGAGTAAVWQREPETAPDAPANHGNSITA